MKCAVVRQYGDALDNLVIDERPDPVPGDHEVAVAVLATALNRGDLLQRRGLYLPPLGVPARIRDIPGLEFVGRIDALGDGVTRWRGSERVFGILPGGGFADRVVTHEDLAVEVPKNLTDTEAAAIPEAFITAFDALVLQAHVSKGERVLIHAVASGVGTAAVQLANVWGAEAIGTAGAEQKLKRVAALASFVPVNYRQTDFKEAVERAYGENAIDVVLDLVGAKYWRANLQLLRSGGRLVLIGRLGGSEAETPLGLLMTKRLRIIGTVMRSRTLAEKIAVTRAFGGSVVPLFEQGELKPVVDSVYPFGDIRQATAKMERNENVGKIVLEW